MDSYQIAGGLLWGGAAETGMRGRQRGGARVGVGAVKKELDWRLRLLYDSTGPIGIL